MRVTVPVAESKMCNQISRAAYKRTIMMNISMLKYYGGKWLKWVRKNTHTGNKSDIPERHQQKKKRVINQTSKTG